MTRVPSSTFNSEGTRASEAASLVAFGRNLLWLTPLLFLAMVAFNIVTVRLGYSALPQLANIGYQLERLDAAERVDTVFFGDSSLGQLIDSATWQALFGETTLSLALTGGEGYVGDLYMLQQVLQRHRPSRVVLVHTADMLTRNIAWSAYFAIRPDAPSVNPPLKRLVREPLEIFVSKDLLVASLEGILARLLDRTLPFLVDGYVRGKPALVVRRSFDPTAPMVFAVEDINPEKTLFLDLVIALCAREGLDCRYAFGPIWDEVCTSSVPYLETVAALIEARGMPVVDGTPICVPVEDLDNTEDHVLPSTRAHYTAELHARLEADERARNRRAGPR
jgi:hypothetical protein